MRKILGIAALIFAISACGVPDDHFPPRNSDLQSAWSQRNNPAQIGFNYKTEFDALPLSGKTTKTPWADTYWPSVTSGIAYRWNGPRQSRYRTYTQSQIENMSEEELKKLSPAEKYSIYVGDYDFKIVRSEFGRTNPGMPRWYGLCHGWAPTAIHFEEPYPVTLENSDGIKVPFGSSDIKGLLTYYTGQVARPPFIMVGNRCDLGGNANTPACNDINAGAFHIVLANHIGVLDSPFVIDATRDQPVWNHPVHAFKSRVNGERRVYAGAARGTVKVLDVTSEVTYTDGIQAQWEALIGTAGHRDRVVSYRYLLELDAQGNIIGGEWLTWHRPDFLWVERKAEFTEEWRGLEEIYKASMSVRAEALEELEAEEEEEREE